MPKTSFIYLVIEGCCPFPHDLLRVGNIVPFRWRDIVSIGNVPPIEKRRILFRRFETVPMMRTQITRNTMQLAPTFESYGWRLVGVYTAPDVAIAVTDFPEGDGKRRTA